MMTFRQRHEMGAPVSGFKAYQATIVAAVNVYTVQCLSALNDSHEPSRKREGAIKCVSPLYLPSIKQEC